jgi:hypothetical protein
MISCLFERLSMVLILKRRLGSIFSGHVVFSEALRIAAAQDYRARCSRFLESRIGYTTLTMKVEDEDCFLNPPPGSAAARAVEFGIDLTLTLENLRLTPEERIRKLDRRLAAIAKSKAVEHYQHPKDLLMLLELEAIHEYQQQVRSKENKTNT